MACQGYREEDHEEARAGSQEFSCLSDAQCCWDTLQSSWLPELVGGEGGGRKRI